MAAKFVASCGVIALSLLSISACSSGGSEGASTSSPAATAASSSAPATGPITVWVDAAREKQAKAYAAANPDLKATVVTVDDSAGNTTSQISLALNGGNPVPDLVFLGNPADFSNLVTNRTDYAAPLNDLVGQETLDGFATNAMAACTLEGQVYCLRNDLAQTVLYYNTKLFKDFGYEVPKTFDDLKALSDRLAKDHPGYSLGAVNGRYGLDAYYASSQCKYNTATSPTTVTISTSAPECTRVNAVFGPMLANKTLSPLDPFDPAFTKILSSDKLVATVSPSWMGEFGIKPASKAEGVWAVAPMPTWNGADNNWSGAVGGGVWVAYKGSPNLAAAVKMAVGMTTDLTVAKDSPTFPAYKAAADAWLAKVSADKWYASDPAPVYIDAASKITATLSFVRYQQQAQDSFNATVIKDAGANIDSAWSAFSTQVASAAESAGYQVES